MDITFWDFFEGLSLLVLLDEVHCVPLRIHHRRSKELGRNFLKCCHRFWGLRSWSFLHLNPFNLLVRSFGFPFLLIILRNEIGVNTLFNSLFFSAASLWTFASAASLARLFFLNVTLFLRAIRRCLIDLHVGADDANPKMH